MTIHVVVQFKALAASREAFKTIMGSVARDLPKIEGCRAVQVLQSSTDDCNFTLVETWESRERHQAHVDGLIADGTWATIAEHLSEEPRSGYFDKL